MGLRFTLVSLQYHYPYHLSASICINPSWITSLNARKVQNSKWNIKACLTITRIKKMDLKTCYDFYEHSQTTPKNIRTLCNKHFSEAIGTQLNKLPIHLKACMCSWPCPELYANIPKSSCFPMHKFLKLHSMKLNTGTTITLSWNFMQVVHWSRPCIWPYDSRVSCESRRVVETREECPWTGTVSADWVFLICEGD